MTTEQRAAVAAAVLTAGQEAPRLLASLGEQCAAAAAELLALERSERARRLAMEIAMLRSPVPVGIERVHPEWIERAMVGAGEHARSAVAGERTDGPTQRWWQRRVFGQLVAMPPDALLDGADLPVALVTFGRRTLAVALAQARREQVAAVAARLGEPHASALVAEVAAQLRGTGSTLAARRALALVGGLMAGPSEQSLLTVGLRRVAGLLVAEGGDVPRRWAQRLPVALGTELLGAVAAESATGGDAEWEEFRGCLVRSAGR